MSSPDRSLWSRIENYFPIVLGISEVLIGFVLVFIELILPSLDVLIAKLLSDLGIGIIAAGLVTATLEPISRKRLQSDIAEIKKSHFEAILRGVMPEKIYEEIQAHIIRQPFLRENVRINFEFEWADSEREILLRNQASYYEVTNISKTIEKYDVRIIEEREMGLKSLGLPKITGIIIKQDNQDEIVLSNDDLLAIQKSTDQYIEVCYPVSLKPGKKIKVWLKSQSALSNRVHTLIMLIPTINLDLTISHSEDTVVRAFPLHPSTDNFITYSDTDKLKQWRIEGGILPYQGIELSWYPKSNSSHKKDKM